MTLSSKPDKRSIPWFWIGIAGIFLVSVFLRFWGLSRFNTLVFDEIYYAKFANNYLTHTPFPNGYPPDGHPPLSKYIIAVGIWLGSHLPFGKDTVNNLAGSQYSTFSYRWLNALTGSLIPLVMGAVAYQVSHRRSYAFIACLFTAADGLFLVESRYALNNVYLVIFGLLGQWLLLLALDTQSKRREFWLALSGICFGASASIKWNGLGFLLGAYLLLICAWVMRLIPSLKPTTEAIATQTLSTADLQPQVIQTPLQNLTQLKFIHIIFDLGITPAVVYYLSWIPYLQLHPARDFWGLQKYILSYHQQTGDTSVHPYCSAWYTWPWMIRPVGYFFERTGNPANPALSVGASASVSSGKEIYYDVHGMGNPVLWWFSAVAIVLLVAMLALKVRDWMVVPQTTTNQNVPLVQPAELWVALYLILNYAAGLLPWATIKTCTFLYRYMSASVFAFLAIAWIVDLCLRSYDLFLRAVGVTIIFLILLAFVFWLPVYLGLPLSPEEFQSRMWFRSWI